MSKEELRNKANEIIQYADFLEPGIIKRDKYYGNRNISMKRSIIGNALRNHDVRHQWMADAMQLDVSSVTTSINRYDQYKYQIEMYSMTEMKDFEKVINREILRKLNKTFVFLGKD